MSAEDKGSSIATHLDLGMKDIPGDGEHIGTRDRAEIDRMDRAIIRKFDFTVLPLVIMIYLLAYIDRANIGNARVAGLAKDLQISDYQYKLAVTLTYIPYILVEIPSNLALKRVGPKWLLPLMSTAWGLVCTLQSQVSSFGGLVAVRIFLGGCEGGLFPGLILYLSFFYRRRELQLRIALFFCAVSLSGAFSGLLAAAIQQLDGKGGLRGWQWIFLLEGLFTICFGIASFFLLPNGPQTMKILNNEQKEHWNQQMKEDSNNFVHHTVNLNQAISILRDPHVLIFLPIFFASGGLGIGLSVFTPTIVRALGYSSTITQLLTLPPYALAFIATTITAYISDRYGARGATAFVAGLPALAGAIMMLLCRSFASRYTGICLLVMGSYAAVPSTLTWLPNNTAGYSRRATAVAVLATMTSCGGIVSTWIYPTSSAPYFKFGSRYNIGMICMMQVLIVVNVLWLRRLNQIKKQMTQKLLAGYEDLTEEEQLEVLGDHHPKYTYCY